ncbi:hypothetical protein PIB30_059051 [Stylosanthes scabra]|uniref:Aminotransferase-like plant mobile domain-containing protein n=1 Tax=Stylosanthes scabra TaxID=79078 RepID=A0ABU6XKF9_9FABA|nr:hypothetical protein [Stylosanthes scabra]
MAKKKSCQNVHNPRLLSPAERELYGWVDPEVFTQSSVLASEHLPELRREMRLAQDLASERDYVLGPIFGGSMSSCLRAWALVFLFRIFRGRLTRCQVAVSQLHLNGWGFLRTFERGRRLFDAFEESIQEFKWHYFKVLPLPGTRPFWVDDEGSPYPWVYWNSEARECRVMALDPLETLAFDFLQSLPVGLGKRFNFRCRWILDHSDAEVGAFLDSLLADMEKQSRFDRLKQKMAEVAGVGPRSVFPHVRAPPTTFGASASSPAVPSSTPTASAAPNPLPAGEEGAKEDPSADLKRKGRKRKASGTAAEEAALGVDASWAHKVSPVERAFPEDYNFRGALDAGLTNGIQMEKELASLKDQVDVLTVERDSALAAPLLNAEIKSLTQRL